jgi:hypothetical protein
VGLQSVNVWPDTKPATARTAEAAEKVEVRMVEWFRCFFLGKSSVCLLKGKKVLCGTSLTQQ